MRNDVQSSRFNVESLTANVFRSVLSARGSRFEVDFDLSNLCHPCIACFECTDIIHRLRGLTDYMKDKSELWTLNFGPFCVCYNYLDAP